MFDDAGRLHVVDVTAPAGAPKVIAVDLEARTTSPFFPGAGEPYTSAQISPLDGRMYLTNFATGAIDSISMRGDDQRAFFSGPVAGLPMQPDDLAFDAQGNLYVSDFTGYDNLLGERRGRVVRIDSSGRTATVLAAGLPSPNGISFDADFAGLFVSGYTENRIDYLGLGPGGATLTTAHPAVHVSAGGGGVQVDSNAVDAAGNIYQGLYRRPDVLVYDREGAHVATIHAPIPDDGVYSAVNIPIEPGTREGYMIVDGPSGGFVYGFDALGAGIRQSNGG